MKLSIITVCLNAESTIKQTLLSVMNQSYKNFEYIIWDGQSKDETLNIVEDVCGNDERVKVITEPDKGIYSAMNLALDYVTGDYVLFMNSGDSLNSVSTLAQAVEAMNGCQEAIYCFECLFVYRNGSIKTDYSKRRDISRKQFVSGKTVCHQAYFTKASLYNEKKFDETLKYWADQDWLMYFVKKKIKIKYIDVILSNYDGYGVSSDIANIDVIRKECDIIMRRYFIPEYYALMIPKKIKRKILK